MRVFITGAGGFIGGALARHLHSKGIIVRGSSHDLAKLGMISESLEQVYEFGLESEINAACFDGCDAIVHCAYDPRPGKGQQNVDGTLSIFHAAERAGVKYQLFISSHSARQDAISEYGRQKFEIEKFFLEHIQAVVRPGLVVGKGGLFEKNRKLILGSPILVMPGANRFPVYYVSLTDLLTCLMTIVDNRLLGAYNIFTPSPILLRNFVNVVLATEGKRRMVFSLPVWIFQLSGTLMRKLGLKNLALLESVETALLNVRSPVHHSHILTFLERPRELKKAIQILAGRADA